MVALILELLGNRWGQIVLVIIGMHVYDDYQYHEKLNAVITQVTAKRDAEWKGKLQKAEEENAAKVQAAIDAAKVVPVVPADRDKRLRLCASSADCRKNG